MSYHSSLQNAYKLSDMKSTEVSIPDNGYTHAVESFGNDLSNFSQLSYGAGLHSDFSTSPLLGDMILINNLIRSLCFKLNRNNHIVQSVYNSVTKKNNELNKVTVSSSTSFQNLLTWNSNIYNSSSILNLFYILSLFYDPVVINFIENTYNTDGFYNKANEIAVKTQICGWKKILNRQINKIQFYNQQIYTNGASVENDFTPPEFSC